MLPPLPRCSSWVYSSLISPRSVSLPRKGHRVGLHIVLFEVCSAFTRVAACTLARSPYFMTRYPKASDISSPPCLLRLLPAGANRRVGLAPTGKRRLVTAHTLSGPCSLAKLQLGDQVGDLVGRQEIATATFFVCQPVPKNNRWRRRRFTSALPRHGVKYRRRPIRLYSRLRTMSPSQRGYRSGKMRRQGLLGAVTVGAAAFLVAPSPSPHRQSPMYYPAHRRRTASHWGLGPSGSPAPSHTI